MEAAPGDHRLTFIDPVGAKEPETGAPAAGGAVQVKPGWALPLSDDAFAAAFEKEFRYAVRDARTLLSFAMAPVGAALYLALSVLRAAFRVRP